MDTVRITKRVFLMFCLCFVSAVTASASNVCATDSLGGAILLKTDTDLVADAVVGLHGKLTLADGTTVIPLYGTALVNHAGDSMLIAVQGLQAVAAPLNAGQHIGILINTDLSLNGTGTFETLISTGSGMPRFNFDSSSVIWTGTNC